MTSKIITSKEPIIRVGIILPADKIENVDIVLSECDSFEIETNEKIYPSCKNNSNLTISINDHRLGIDELDVATQKIIINPTIGMTFPLTGRIVPKRFSHITNNSCALLATRKL